MTSHQDRQNWLNVTDTTASELLQRLASETEISMAKASADLHDRLQALLSEGTIQPDDPMSESCNAHPQLAAAYSRYHAALMGKHGA